MSEQITSTNLSRFSPIAEDDHAGYLWIVTILAFIYSTIASAIRAHIKRGIYGLEDYCIAAATLVHLAQAAVVFQGLLYGLAKFNSITTPDSWSIAGRSFVTSEILSLLVLALTKCSIASLMLRIFAADKWKNWAICSVTILLCAIWGLGSMIALGVDCDFDTSLVVKNSGQCALQYDRWRVITVTDIFTEIIICLLPVLLTWPLKMAVALKVQVVVAFNFRLPLIIISAFHLKYIRNYPVSQEPQFEVTNAILFQQAMITWALISATIPNMKSFFSSISTGFLFPAGWESSNNGSASYPLQPLKARSLRRYRQQSELGYATGKDSGAVRHHEPVLRSDLIGNHSAIANRGTSSEQTEDDCNFDKSSTRELIITKKLHWSIYHEES